MVAQLGSPRFAERAAAERSLWNSGPVILKHLAALDHNQLSPEQRGRISQLQGRFSYCLEGDRCERIAAWLSADQSTWLTLLQHEDSNCRQAAFEQLRRMSGDKVTLIFSPQASKSTRDEQISNLQLQLARKP